MSVSPKPVFRGQAIKWFETHSWIKPEEIGNWVYTAYQANMLKTDPEFKDNEHKILTMMKKTTGGTKRVITIRVHETQELGCDVLIIFRLHADRL